MPPSLRPVLLALLWLPSACIEDATAPSVPVFAVAVSPAAAALYPTATAPLTATLTDSLGDTLSDRTIVWTSGDTTVAFVDSTGQVTGMDGGVTSITATSEGRSGSATIMVTAADSIVVVPTRATIVPGGVFHLKVMALDSLGDSLPGYPLVLASSDTDVATVTPARLVAGRAPGTATITATNRGLEGHVSLAVRTVTFATVEASEWITGCGITTDSAAFCWGTYDGQGAGIREDSRTPIGIALDERMIDVTSGDGFSCGLTDAGVAYCWGSNSGGRLGLGLNPPFHASLVPLPVAGGIAFSALSSGWSHTCGLDSSGAAWCWGSNQYGGLGTGPPGNTQIAPTAVTGGVQFRSIAAGGYNTTCGVAADSSAYCWGYNGQGQVGSGDSLETIFVPTLVAGGLRFRTVQPGWTHSCGVATDGTAYCWGNNFQGALGTGDTSSSRAARPVAGGMYFVDIVVGGHSATEFTCGITAAGSAFCWGGNYTGQLGNGSTTPSLVPEPVAGGFTFAQITAGEGAACAIATTGTAYCWGWGQALGSGTNLDSSVPIRIAGQP